VSEEQEKSFDFYDILENGSASVYRSSSEEGSRVSYQNAMLHYKLGWWTKSKSRRMFCIVMYQCQSPVELNAAPHYVVFSSLMLFLPT